MEGVMIIADPSGKGFIFAKKVYEYIRDKKDRTFPIKMIFTEKTIFKDGEFKLKIKENIRRSHCFLIQDPNKEPCNWFTELTFFLNAIKYSSPSEITLVLPYTKFARQERKEESRTVVSAQVLAQTISQYANRGLTVDLHNPAMQAFFSIPFDNLLSSPAVIDYLQMTNPEFLKDLTIVSPDLGGGKRAELLIKLLEKRGIKAELALGYKSRTTPNEVQYTKIIGKVEGRNCLIVDDIIDTGGTLTETNKELKKQGAKKVYAYATHALLTKGIDHLQEIDKILISDTIFQESRGNIEIISLANLFGEAIYRTVLGESLSSLFEV